MTKWTFDNDSWTWICPACGFGWGKEFDGEFDDTDYSPYEFGMFYCPRCGENLSDEE